MKTKVNVGLILQTMQDRRLRSFDKAGAICGVAPDTIRAIVQTGELPKRIDALFRIAQGLDLRVEELIITDHAATRKKTAGTLELVSHRRAHN